MAVAVYILCGVTALTCAALLVRAWLRSRTRFLLWAAFCFVALAANSVLLFVDLVLIPERDLSMLRSGSRSPACQCFYGLVWERVGR
jgi:hypothetical protein